MLCRWTDHLIDDPYDAEPVDAICMQDLTPQGTRQHRQARHVVPSNHWGRINTRPPPSRMCLAIRANKQGSQTQWQCFSFHY